MDWEYHDGRGGGFAVSPHVKAVVTGAPAEIPGQTLWVHSISTHFDAGAEDGPELQVYGYPCYHEATHQLRVVEMDAPLVTDLCAAPEEPEWRWYEWLDRPISPLELPVPPISSWAHAVEHMAKAHRWVHSVLDVWDYHYSHNPNRFVVEGRYHLYRAWYWKQVQ